MGSESRYKRSVVAVAAALVPSVILVACAPHRPEELTRPIATHSPPPPWAYPIQPPVKLPPDDGVPRRIPGSEIALTVTQLRDLYVAPVWHPSDHPRLPGVVGLGRKPSVFACGFCHYPNGQGRPENSSLAGLTAGYIVQQMEDYKKGLRKSSEPKMRPPALMVDNAKHATAEDVRISAQYFASLKYKPWVRVVETDTVPKTHVAGSMLTVIDGAGSEPIGQRIIEVAETAARSALRDYRSGFVAYVPRGSIEKGKVLVTTGGQDRTVACGTCHGQELQGLGDMPPLAGRSPSYAVRQLYDFQSGARAGALSAQMKEAVAKLTIEDMVAIAAYTASLTP